MLVNHTGASAVASGAEGFSLEDFEKVGVQVVERRFGVKDVIFTPGDPDDRLYFLFKGAVRLYKIYGEYKEATTALLREGSVFGKLSLIGGYRQDVFAEALTDDARVAGVYKATLTEMVRRDPGFCAEAVLVLLGAAQAVGSGDRKPPPSGGLDASGDAALEPERPVRRG